MAVADESGDLHTPVSETEQKDILGGGENNTFLLTSRNVLAEGLFELLKPTIETLDANVKRTRESHIHLRLTIDNLAEDLRNISDTLREPIDLESYVKKLGNCKRRVMVINGILQNTQDRINKLQFAVTKETTKRKALLDPSASLFSGTADESTPQETDPPVVKDNADGESDEKEETK